MHTLTYSDVKALLDLLDELSRGECIVGLTTRQAEVRYALNAYIVAEKGGEIAANDREARGQTCGPRRVEPRLEARKDRGK